MSSMYKLWQWRYCYTAHAMQHNKKLQRFVYLLSLEAVVQWCSVKKVFLEISQNSQENTYVAVSFLIKSPETPRTPFYIEHLWWLLLYLLSCMVTFERNKLRANWGWDYIHQRHIEDPVRHLIWAFGKNSKRLRDFYYFYKKFHLRCLTEPPVSYAYSLMISIYLTWHKTKI